MKNIIGIDIGRLEPKRSGASRYDDRFDYQSTENFLMFEDAYKRALKIINRELYNTTDYPEDMYAVITKQGTAQEVVDRDCEQTYDTKDIIYSVARIENTIIPDFIDKR